MSTYPGYLNACSVENTGWVKNNKTSAQVLICYCQLLFVDIAGKSNNFHSWRRALLLSWVLPPLGLVLHLEHLGANPNEFITTLQHHPLS